MTQNEELQGRLNALHQKIAQLDAAISAYPKGLKTAVRSIYQCYLADSHVLLKSDAGLHYVAADLFCSTQSGFVRRMQFAPDLMPSDLTGTEVLEDTGTGRRFAFLPGPIFANVFYASDLNRASPRTQTALIHVMRDRTVRVSGVEYTQLVPFLVLGIYSESVGDDDGTYSLPHVQLDEFMMQINVNLESVAEEYAFLQSEAYAALRSDKAVISNDDIVNGRLALASFPLSEKISATIMRIATFTRDGMRGVSPHHIVKGLTSRGMMQLRRAIQTAPIFDGRVEATLDDVVNAVRLVLPHRLVLSFAARAEGVDAASICAKICEELL